MVTFCLDDENWRDRDYDRPNYSSRGNRGRGAHRGRGRGRGVVSRNNFRQRQEQTAYNATESPQVGLVFIGNN